MGHWDYMAPDYNNLISCFGQRATDNDNKYGSMRKEGEEMAMIVSLVLWIVHIISSVITALFAVFAVYDLFMGHERAGKLLERLHIPLSFKQALVLGFSCLILKLTTERLL